jgi:hypothetical protein
MINKNRLDDDERVMKIFIWKRIKFMINGKVCLNEKQINKGEKFIKSDNGTKRNRDS